MYDFLLRLNRRPFIKRFLRSDEIQQEIHACENALGDALQMFSVRVKAVPSPPSVFMIRPNLYIILTFDSGRYQSKSEC